MNGEPLCACVYDFDTEVAGERSWVNSSGHVINFDPALPGKRNAKLNSRVCLNGDMGFINNNSVILEIQVTALECEALHNPSSYKQNWRVGIDLACGGCDATIQIEMPRVVRRVTCSDEFIG